jgi:hypothetical protein
VEVRLNTQDAPAVNLSEQVAGVTQRLAQEQEGWRQRLLRDPSRFRDVETAVHHAFQQMADQVIAGLLADVGRQPVLEDAAKKSC